METCVLLSLLLVLGCATVNGAPVEHGDIEPGSCEDASTKAAAELALTKINQDREEGYIFGLHRLSNAHIKKHGEKGVLFYLTLDVVETNCSVVSRKDWKSCGIRPDEFTKVYGQCKAVIFIGVVPIVDHLCRYNCVVRPGGMLEGCAGCRVVIDHDEEEVRKVVFQSLEKFNNQSGRPYRFALLHICRATSQVVSGLNLRVEYTIRETPCPNSAEAVTAETCPLVDFEFAHKGFCQAIHFRHFSGQDSINVECEIYEPEAAGRQKMHHLLGGETNHSHHQHGHEHETTPHNHTQGTVRRLPELARPVTLPSFPDIPTSGPEVGVTLPLKPDPQIPGQQELIIPIAFPFPSSVSAQCPTKEGKYQKVEELLAQDPMFKSAA